MLDQLPRRVDQVGEHRVFHGPDDERLARGVDVLAGDLEQAVFAAQTAKSFQLLRRVAGRHVGDGADAAVFDAGDHVVQIVVLELLRLLVARDGGCHVAEIGVAQECVDFITQLGHVTHVRAFIRCVNVNFRHERGFQNAQQIVLVERIRGIEHLVLLLFTEAQADGCEIVYHRLALSGFYNHFLCQRVQQDFLADIPS